jgi:hypothetical protein
MKFLYVSTVGADDPVKAAIPWHLMVNGSVPEGHDVMGIALAGDATDLVIGGKGEQLMPLGLPPMRELFQKVRDTGIPVYI